MTDRSLPARTIPVPAAASPELQAAIALPLDTAIQAIQQCPQTREEWLTTIAAFDSFAWERLKQLRRTLPVTVVKEEMAGVTVYRLTPQTIATENQGRVILHFHGGGYGWAGGELSMGEGLLMADRGQIPVISVDYRQCPDHPFPAGLEDAIAVWQVLQASVPPQSIGLLGTSAGGGLILALMQRLRELNLPLPGAIAPLTPWADLTKTSDSLFTHEYIDGTAISYDGVIGGIAQLYAGDYGLTHPLVSPLYGDFTGFPPTLLVSGTRDLLLSDTARVQRKLRAVGVTVELQLFEGLSHADYLYWPDTPESRAVFQEVRLFFNRHLAP